MPVQHDIGIAVSGFHSQKSLYRYLSAMVQLRHLKSFLIVPAASAKNQNQAQKLRQSGQESRHIGHGRRPQNFACTGQFVTRQHLGLFQHFHRAGTGVKFHRQRDQLKQRGRRVEKDAYKHQRFQLEQKSQ